jgi:predicted ferric reductase
MLKGRLLYLLVVLAVLLPLAVTAFLPGEGAEHDKEQPAAREQAAHEHGSEEAAHGGEEGHEEGGFILYLGLSFAVAGFCLLCLQLVESARLKALERGPGLDMILRFHKKMALFTFGLLLAHPVLVAWGEGHWSLLYSLNLPWPILLGKAVLILALLQILGGMFWKKLGLKFESWRMGHAVIGPLAVLGAFTHGFIVGHDLENPVMQFIWSILLLGALTAFGYHKLIKPKHLAVRPYTVQEVVPETHDVHTVKLAPPEGAPVFDYQPGQFHFLTFLDSKALPKQEHHFTISSSPTQRDVVTSTIKSSGDFTSQIARLEVGARVAVEGPFGRFSYTFFHDPSPYVFVAGGIGVTPLMAMLRHMRDTGDSREVLLLFANQTEKDIAFRDELEDMAAGGAPRLTVVHVIAEPQAEWSGERGLLDKEKINRLITEPAERTWLLCCPPPMTEAVLESLGELKVPFERIHTERFEL